MKDYYDFKNCKRGAVIPLPPNYSMVSIPLNNQILEWFGNQVDEAGGGDYLKLITKKSSENSIRMNRIFGDQFKTKNG